MDERLRATARSAFLDLNLPEDVTLDSLVRHVEEARGRQIVIVESAKLSGKKICGLWIPRPEKDVIYHSVTRGPLHKQQMVLHEVSHMVLRHDEAADAAWQGIAVFREVSGEVVDKALARGDFRCDLEVTAEHLADFFAAAIREASQEIYGYEAFFE